MKAITHTRAFEMAVPISDLFPLFSPEGERYWVPDWNYENIMGTTELFEDYIFLTKTHDHATSDAVWIVKSYDPESHFVRFYKVEPADKVGVVTVKCEKLEAEKTNVQVTYKYIALSPAGEEFISGFTAGAYEEFIGEWESLLSEYFMSKK